MKQRGVNRVTMAVWDLERGKRFYEKLGWTADPAPFVEAGIAHRRMTFVPPAEES